SIRKIVYIYRDRRSYNEDPNVVSVLSYTCRGNGLDANEEQLINVYKSVKFQMRRYEKDSLYYFYYPMPCSVKDFTKLIQYVTVNSPAYANEGTALKGFLVGQSPADHPPSIDTAVSYKMTRLRHDGYINIALKDTAIGGKSGKVIHFQSADGINKR